MIKVLLVFNQYRSLFNGEEAVVFRTAELLERHGGQARLLLRSSRDIKGGLLGKVRAFFSGIYSWEAATAVSQLLAEYRPDVVHVHNLYPLFSPSVLVACRKLGYPVVMTLHNQHLTCPRADHLCHGKLCDRCVGGHEYHCVLRNCRNNMLESVAYALRSGIARRFRWIHDHVNVLVALTDFARQRLVEAGFDSRQIRVLPNMAPGPREPVDASRGAYAAFAGRLSPEKGLHVLMEAADKLPDIPIRVAGGGPLFETYWQRTPANVQLLGQRSADEMADFYRGARFLVLPSTNYEMCPLVISESMSHGVPVVASRIGGLPELVDDGRTGLLFQPGDSQDLASKMRRLWDDAPLCGQLGQAAWETARDEFGEELYVQRLLDIYHQAMRQVGRDPQPDDGRNKPVDSLLETATP
jgi:glycosyltransferase involved in cell wall biosynthesis